MTERKLFISWAKNRFLRCPYNYSVYVNSFFALLSLTAPLFTVQVPYVKYSDKNTPLTFGIVRLHKPPPHTHSVGLSCSSEKSRCLALAGGAKSGCFLCCCSVGEISPFTSSTSSLTMLISKPNPKPKTRQLLPKKQWNPSLKCDLITALTPMVSLTHLVVRLLISSLLVSKNKPCFVFGKRDMQRERERLLCAWLLKKRHCSHGAQLLHDNRKDLRVT